MSATPARISIVIPAYREGDRINALIEDIRRIDRGNQCEIIVVDGSPSRDTIGRVEDRGVIALASAKGRARQMNAGAAFARGDAVLFLHADTYLPRNAVERILAVTSDDRYAGGAFSIDFDSERRAVRWIARLASLRSRLTRAPLGDHAIFVRREFFNQMAGYRDIPIMEDIDLVRRVRKHGGRLRVLGERVTTSARRVEGDGSIRYAIRNCILFVLYYLGVPPRWLQAHYPDHEPKSDYM